MAGADLALLGAYFYYALAYGSFEEQSPLLPLLVVAQHGSGLCEIEV
jgi:hypothetical protein